MLSVSGKGGTGKTLIAALLIREILALREGACVLAVDADADANLADALGVSCLLYTSDAADDGESERDS